MLVVLPYSLAPAWQNDFQVKKIVTRQTDSTFDKILLDSSSLFGQILQDFAIMRDVV